jgi:hypothetical protein
MRADGLIPTVHEMNGLFRHMPLESIQTHVPLPRHPDHFGAKVVFRNVGHYNDLRTYMQRFDNMISGIWCLYDK